jgi:hypothetical protein
MSCFKFSQTTDFAAKRLSNNHGQMLVDFTMKCFPEGCIPNCRWWVRTPTRAVNNRFCCETIIKQPWADDGRFYYEVPTLKYNGTGN